MARVPLFTKVGAPDQIKDLQKRTAGAPLPILQVDKDTLISQFSAVAGYIARSSGQSELTDSLLGATPFQAAKIEQAIYSTLSEIVPKAKVIEGAIFGTSKDAGESAKSLADLKTVLKRFNDQMGE